MAKNKKKEKSVNIAAVAVGLSIIILHVGINMHSDRPLLVETRLLQFYFVLLGADLEAGDIYGGSFRHQTTNHPQPTADCGESSED